MNELYIFSIGTNNSECEIFEFNELPWKVKYIEIGIEYFLSNYLENKNNHAFWLYNNCSLYILRNGNFSDIKGLFTNIIGKEIEIVKGARQKSHVISPVDFRLSCYLMILCNMDYNKFSNANSFNEDIRSKCKPSADNTP